VSSIPDGITMMTWLSLKARLSPQKPATITLALPLSS
jgi:hypothetical protein